MSDALPSSAQPDLLLTRMRRIPYFAALLLLLPAGSLASYGAGTWAAAYGDAASAAASGVTNLALVFVPLLLFSVRRLRDLEMPGWLAIAWLVPLLNVLLAILLCAMPGAAAANRNGPPPAATPRWVGYLILGLTALWIVTATVYLRTVPDAFKDWAQ
ncbi:uncharacterized membrane protein YhaH (DUF805 family) [Pseudoduganella flava]|uniref:DUF805 domain-containing protein n=1 Tax=Pseudoduganella flava TaxID=871742 RepID=A0A562PLE3_9BURK|nr:DUF805 domain-containing protein [Pseudoduganella flava]QGZ41015.1 DUF805 domain-containing protein [Pseudoduganella flava]TWI45291.1 uncharacterized membrane protein YhaH (DUF805 family) [Pseudoduganella flava]